MDLCWICVGASDARPYRRLRFWQNCLPWVMSCWLLKKSRPQDILLIERALPAAGQPPYVITRNNRTVGTAGGYFFLPLCTDHNNTHAREGTGLAARPQAVEKVCPSADFFDSLNFYISTPVQ